MTDLERKLEFLLHCHPRIVEQGLDRQFYTAARLVVEAAAAVADRNADCGLDCLCGLTIGDDIRALLKDNS